MAKITKAQANNIGDFMANIRRKRGRHWRIREAKYWRKIQTTHRRINRRNSGESLRRNISEQNDRHSCSGRSPIDQSRCPSRLLKTTGHRLHVRRWQPGARAKKVAKATLFRLLTPMYSILCLFRLFHFLNQRRNDLEQVPHHSDIRDLENWRLGVFIDRDDAPRALHTDDVLNRP